MPKCSTPYCKHEARKGHSICGGCDKKKWRAKYPMKAAYQTLKYNATRRNIYFDLTLQEFEEFAFDYQYMRGRGRSSRSYTVARIEEDEPLPGYTRGNLRVLPKSINSSRCKILSYDWETKYARVRTKEGATEEYYF